MRPRLRTLNDVLPTATWDMLCDMSLMTSRDNYLCLFNGREYIRKPVSAEQILEMMESVKGLLKI